MVWLPSGQSTNVTHECTCYNAIIGDICLLYHSFNQSSTWRLSWKRNFHHQKTGQSGHPNSQQRKSKTLSQLRRSNMKSVSLNRNEISSQTGKKIQSWFVESTTFFNTVKKKSKSSNSLNSKYRRQSCQHMKNLTTTQQGQDKI